MYFSRKLMLEFMIWVVAMFCSAPALTQIVIGVLPAAPRDLEPVRARISYGEATRCFGGQVSMSGATITLRVSCGGDLSAVPASYDIELGRFPAGQYTVEVRTQTLMLATMNFTVTERHPTQQQPPFFPLVDYTDIWWNPQESGWGLTITQHVSDRIFAAWFVYDQNRQPVWYTLQPGQWTSPTRYTGPIYRTTGPFFGGPFDPNLVTITQVGTGTLSFTDANNGTFSYTVENITATKTITRMVY